jgi:F-type H+/Na+-transporting ATPase subunit alpha
MEVGKQVMVIWAATNGFIDALKIEEIARWQDEFVRFLELAKSDLLSRLEQNWDDEIAGEVKSATEEFMREFSKEQEPV